MQIDSQKLRALSGFPFFQMQGAQSLPADEESLFGFENSQAAGDTNLSSLSSTSSNSVKSTGLMGKPDEISAELNKAVANGIISQSDAENIQKIANKEMKLCSASMTPEKYEYINNLLFGEQKDKVLASKINQLSE